MPTNYSSPQVVCRPALPSDAPAVLEFTKFIWHGHDYIKYVWDDWLADPQGILAVAEYAGCAVALGKVSRVADGQWWMEGVRVDPALQGLKIGSHMFKYLQDWWSENAGGVFRLMTASDRVQMHHLCDRFGWAKVGDVIGYVAPAAPGAHSFRPVIQDELAQALAFASANPGANSGLMDLGWKFIAPDEATLAEQVRQGQLFWWQERAGLLSYWEDEEDGEKILALGLLATSPGSLQALLADTRRLVDTTGLASVLWHAPVRSDVEAALTAAGYESSWDGSGYLYAKI